MAHRLPPAGILTPQSEHYVNYIVVPKPSASSVYSDATSSCSLRPKFLCLRQPPAQTSYKCVDLCQSPCPPSPLGRECASRVSCHHHQKTRCLPKPCPCCTCCVRKEVNVLSPACCCSDTDCCSKEVAPACAIKITLPRSDDQVIEQKMKKKLKKLVTDVEKFDQALACLKHRKLHKIECVSDPCTQRCYCCRPKPTPVHELCCVSRVCPTKPVSVYCRPFYGKKKTET